MSKKELIIIASITSFIIIVWVVSDIVHSKPTVQLDSKLESILEPVDPNFDQETLNKIKTISLQSPPPITAKASVAPTSLPLPSANLTQPISSEAADLNQPANSSSSGLPKAVNGGQ